MFKNVEIRTFQLEVFADTVLFGTEKHLFSLAFSAKLSYLFISLGEWSPSRVREAAVPYWSTL